MIYGGFWSPDSRSAEEKDLANLRNGIRFHEKEIDILKRKIEKFEAEWAEHLSKIRALKKELDIKEIGHE